MLVDIAGDELLAGSGIAGDDEARIGWCDKVEPRLERQRCRVLEDQSGRPPRPPVSGRPKGKDTSVGSVARRHDCMKMAKVAHGLHLPELANLHLVYRFYRVSVREATPNPTDFPEKRAKPAKCFPFRTLGDATQSRPGGRACLRCRFDPGLELIDESTDSRLRCDRELIVRDEVGVGRVEPGRKRMGAEEGEERPEMMLDHQRMPVGATGRRKDDGAPGEHGRVDEVEEMLEETGIGGLVDGRRNDQHVGGLDRGQHALGRGGKLAALDGGAELGAGVDEIEELDLAKAARLRLAEDCTDQRARPRRPREVAADTDDTERGMAISLGA